MCYVLIGTFIGIGALSRDAGFDLVWTLLGTTLVWAGPAQLILISTLTSTSSLTETAFAVCLSGIRLLPMVVALLPQLRTARTRRVDLVLPAHMTAVTFWLESLRMIPHVPREYRLAFVNGLGLTLMGLVTLSTAIGHLVAGSLPPLLGLAVLFLTPVVFLLSLVHSSRRLQDFLALALGLVLTPLIGLLNTGIDLLISALIAGTVAFGLGRLIRSRAASPRDRDPVQGGGP